MPQDIHGVVIIDKPPNVSSAGVVAQVKSLLVAKKVGHAGTLDPFATGVIVCCVNRATRLARFFLRGEKKYEALLHLGVETDTQDLTGALVSQKEVPAVSAADIAAVLKTFKGRIEQTPPVYSALKHKGIPLYRHARQGVPVQKPARRIDIFAIAIIDIQLPFVRFEVVCSAGTYIRTLCADIGRAIGCGGHLKELRRLESSGFGIEEALSLEKFGRLVVAKCASDHIIGMAAALRGMPEWTADRNLKAKIVHGVSLTKHDVTLAECMDSRGFVKIIDDNHDLLAVIEHKKDQDGYNYCCVFN